MAIFNSDTATPQFDTAEYAGQDRPDCCRNCGQSIVGSYFRVNDRMICPSCADLLQRSIPQQSHSAFVRAVLLGGCAAVAGLIAYAAFGILT